MHKVLAIAYTDSHAAMQARQRSPAWTAAPTATLKAALLESLACRASTLAGQTMAAGLHPHTCRLPAAQLASGPAPSAGMTSRARCSSPTRTFTFRKLLATQQLHSK